MEAAEDFLSVRDISKSFGGVKALDRVSFTAGKKEILGIIGVNGSGKSTLVNALTGFVRPDSGQIRFKGKYISAWPPHKIAQLGITRTFQTVRPFHHLPAFKNLIVPLYSSRIRRFTTSGQWGDRDGVALDLLEEVGFERDSSVPYKAASTLPHGYLRRLELARCLALKPEVIIFDEIFSGLSSSEGASVIPLIEKAHLSGIAIIMVEHRLRELFQLAGKVIVMDQGKKIAEGTPREIMEDAKVKEVYLGTEL